MGPIATVGSSARLRFGPEGRLLCKQIEGSVNLVDYGDSVVPGRRAAAGACNSISVTNHTGYIPHCGKGLD